MVTDVDRPEVFAAAKRERFCALVGVGLPRKEAAAHVGVSPTTVMLCMGGDPQFAEQVREAETECEFQLLRRIQQQSERSWRACVWMLEKMRPERYGRGKAAEAGPNAWDLFGKFFELITQEVTDEALLLRLAERVDDLVRGEFGDENESANPGSSGGFQPPPDRRNVPPDQPGKIESSPATTAPSRNAAQPSKAEVAAASHVATPTAGLPNGPSSAGHGPASRPQALGKGAEAPAGRTEEPLGRDPLARPGNLAADFCNTSPDVHEHRKLARVGT